MRREARLQQHELAIARHQEIDHLAVAVAGRDPLAHQEPQVARQRRVGIVDRLVLAHHAAQLARQVARARFLRRIRHDLVGLHRVGGRASGHHGDDKYAGEKLPQRLTPPAAARGGCRLLGRLRRADAQAAVRERQQAAERHQHRAPPDQEHQRLVIDAHGDGAVGVGVAERNIELAGAAGQQRGLGGRRSPRGEVALRRRHHAQRFAVERDRELRDHLAEIRPLPLRDAVELQLIAGDVCDIVRLHRADIFAVPGGFADDPDQGDADAGMRERGAPGRARQSARTGHRRRQGRAKQRRAFGKIAQARRR